MDEIDQAIVNELQENPNLTVKDLCARVNVRLRKTLSPSTVYYRKNKLVDSGVLKCTFVPNYDEIGKSTLAFIAMKLEGHDEAIFKDIARLKGVMEVHAIGGPYDGLVKLRGEDIHEIANLVFYLRSQFKLIKATETFVVLRTEKETMSLDL